MGHLTTGFWLILGLGLVLLAGAALADRSARIAAERRAVAPPDRDVPGLDEQAPAPAYVPEPVPSRRPDLSDAQQTEVDAQLASRDRLDLKLADPGLATHGTRAIVDNATILVCSDAVSDLRELLQSLERAITGRVPIVIAAPSFDEKTLKTLVANAVAGTLQPVALTGAPDALADLATRTGATAVPSVDLRSGYVPHPVYGHAARLIADASGCWVVEAP
ncbi:MAG TPA: hypothetical protein VLR88_01865 [Propionibacteriaceae bacterium]|nr:hypothetical protein [Propionibacteriaceae bacterium]